MSPLPSILGKHKVRENDQSTPAESSRDESSSALQSKKVFPTGLKCLYEPKSPVVDVIFVHGLTGGRERTWTATNAVSPWPQMLLPTKLPDARILTFGYDADVVHWRAMVSKSRIGNHAEDLLTTVATHREDDNTNYRPILFVAHSLGGLVCEDALLASKNSAEKHLQNILSCTRGMIFLGTPHMGSTLAWPELLAKLVSIVKQTNSQILEVLQHESEVLARIQKEFHSMIRARADNCHPSIAITCFYEQLPLPGIGEVVPKNSAILPAYTSIGIYDNHVGMTKFEAADDPGFKSVAGELHRWVKELKPMSGE
ncbi:hypothetical protein MMC22_011740 [Lobaria immixta]|nr:hypothetical protein [Lobaria immixta]